MTSFLPPGRVPGETSGSSAETQGPCPGQRVILQRLVAPAGLSGVDVEVVALDAATGRRRVKDHSGRVYSVAPDNVEGLSEEILGESQTRQRVVNPSWEYVGASEKARSQSQPGQPGAGAVFEAWCAETFADHAVPTDELTILLLGPPGSGKTSFVNLLDVFPALLHTDFHGVFLGGLCRDGQGRLSTAVECKLSLGLLSLRIVDTPGFRSNSEAQDHLQRIIRGTGTLHAIVVVVDGSESASAPEFSAVCEMVPETARDNVAVVVTNASSKPHSKPGYGVWPPERSTFIDNPVEIMMHKPWSSLSRQTIWEAAVVVGRSLSSFVKQILEMRPLSIEDFNQALTSLKGTKQTQLSIKREYFVPIPSDSESVDRDDFMAPQDLLASWPKKGTPARSSKLEEDFVPSASGDVDTADTEAPRDLLASRPKKRTPTGSHQKSSVMPSLPEDTAVNPPIRQCVEYVGPDTYSPQPELKWLQDILAQGEAAQSKKISVSVDALQQMHLSHMVAKLQKREQEQLARRGGAVTGSSQQGPMQRSRLQGISIQFLVDEFEKELEWCFPDDYHATETFYDLSRMIWGDRSHPIDLLGHASVADEETGKLGVSLSSAVAREFPEAAGTATVFVSHAWSCRIKDFLAALREYCDSYELDMSRTFVWACFFCTNQIHGRPKGEPGSLAEVNTIIGSVGTVLCVLHDFRVGSAVYLRRSWFLYEVFIAAKQGIGIDAALLGPSRDALKQMTMSEIDKSVVVDWQQARATISPDKQEIDEFIGAGHDEFNEIVHQALVIALGKVSKRG